jgi:hypothetical protein
VPIGRSLPTSSRELVAFLPRIGANNFAETAESVAPEERGERSEVRASFGDCHASDRLS